MKNIMFRLVCAALLLAVAPPISAQQKQAASKTTGKTQTASKPQSTGKTQPAAKPQTSGKAQSAKPVPPKAKPAPSAPPKKAATGKVAHNNNKQQPPKSAAKQPNNKSKGQDVPKPIENVIKTNPVSWCLLTADAAWEKVLTPAISIQLGGTYTYQSGEVFDGLTAALNGYSVSPELRYYWMPFHQLTQQPAKGKPQQVKIAAPVSFYTSVWGRMSNYKAHVVFPDHPKTKAEIFNRRAYSGGINFGSQFWLKYKKRPIILCDIALGGGWTEASTQTKLAERGKTIKTVRKGFNPAFGFRVGLPLRK